jgi:hypothetical protein
MWTKKLLSNEYLPHETPKFESDAFKLQFIYKIFNKADYNPPQ